MTQEYLISSANLIFGDEISSSSFLWELWINNVGQNLLTTFNSETSSFNKNLSCIGWCLSNKLPVRSKEKGIAVMFMDSDNEKFWCHVSEEFLDTLFKKHELNKK